MRNEIIGGVIGVTTFNMGELSQIDNASDGEGEFKNKETSVTPTMKVIMKTSVTTDSLGQLIKMLSIYIDRNGRSLKKSASASCRRAYAKHLQFAPHLKRGAAQARRWLQVGQGQQRSSAAAPPTRSICRCSSVVCTGT